MLDWLSYLLLEYPWPVIVPLVGLWAVLRVLGARWQNMRLRLAAVGVLALAMMLAVIAWAVTTDREQLTQFTQRLVEATEEGVDLGVLDRLIEEQATIAGPDGSEWTDYSRIRPGLDRYRVMDQRVTHLEVIMDDQSGATAHLGVVTRFDNAAAGQPIPTAWRLHWREGNDGWRIEQIQWMRLGISGQEPSQQWLGRVEQP